MYGGLHTVETSINLFESSTGVVIRIKFENFDEKSLKILQVQR